MDAEGLVLSVTPLLDSAPLGAPVRVNVELSNDTDMPLPVPASLSLKSEHVSGIAAITAGLDNPVLRPHYGVIEAKRIGRVLKKRAASIDKALALLDKDTVMSWAEARHVSEIKGEKAADEVEGTTADVA